MERWLTTVTNAWSEKAEEDRSGGEVAAEPLPGLEKGRTVARTEALVLGVPRRFLRRRVRGEYGASSGRVGVTRGGRSQLWTRRRRAADSPRVVWFDPKKRGGEEDAGQVR